MSSVVQITENGFAKSAAVEEFPVKARGGKGVIGLAVNDKTGNVVAVLDVVDDTSILLTTKLGQCIRFNADEVRDTYRGGTGVKAIDLHEGDKVVGAAVLPQ
jgi:DNA gyrase subunit A